MTEELNAITKLYDLIKWSLPQIVKFPRAHRFTLGARMENLLFDILESLIEAKYKKEKKSFLQRANLNLEKFRFFVRLCYDMRFINVKKYEYVSREVNEVGRLIGGWIKAIERGQA